MCAPSVRELSGLFELTFELQEKRPERTRPFSRICVTGAFAVGK